jgi:hypothetical protein
MCENTRTHASAVHGLSMPWTELELMLLGNPILSLIVGEWRMRETLGGYYDNVYVDYKSLWDWNEQDNYGYWLPDLCDSEKHYIWQGQPTKMQGRRWLWLSMSNGHLPLWVSFFFKHPRTCLLISSNKLAMRGGQIGNGSESTLSLHLMTFGWVQCGLCVAWNHDIACVCVSRQSQCMNLTVSQIHVVWRYEWYVRGISCCIASDDLKVEIDCDTYMAGSTICLVLIYKIVCMKRKTRVWSYKLNWIYESYQRARVSRKLPV